jgi:proteasome component ECM29
MRIALTDSEKKLEDLLKVYLAPLLLKLGSDYVAVRNKVKQSTRFPLESPSIDIA